MIIIGIDPGIESCGYGVIDKGGRQLQHIASGVIKTSSKKNMANRLLELRQDMLSLLNQYHPGVAGVERLFFGNNVTSAMKVAEARGVILSALAEYESQIRIYEYVPGEIKKALTGNGQATKPWIIVAVKKLLNLELKEDNEADGLAIAITCAYSL